MSIRVTCPGCHTRFNVSDKFAGRDGPCPKCKAKIRIPDKSNEVVIHAPVEAGPKDLKGVAHAKPIFRQELTISPLLWSATIGVIITLFALALLLRFQIADKVNFPVWILAVGSILVGIPAIYGGYGVLRDTDLEAYVGKELWVRVLICAAIYAGLWLLMPVARYAMNGYDTTTWSIALTLMIAIGGAVGMSIFDFDYLVGVLHYGMFLGCALALRWIAGVGVFPGQLGIEAEAATQAMGKLAFQLLRQLV